MEEAVYSGDRIHYYAWFMGIEQGRVWQIRHINWSRITKKNWKFERV